jgi:ubiquinone/menaquinone biosynthesis C-methylase UbiE
MYLYAWMKFVETAPERYDKAMDIMTGGLLPKIKADIVETVNNNSTVLDVGCGTATLAVKLIKQKGCKVKGLDASTQMLKIAEENAGKENVPMDKLDLINGSVTEIVKHFKEDSLDYIVSTVALGEFPKEYLDMILRQCYKVLKKGGKIIIADEVLAENFFARLLQYIVMAAVWIPQFLILRRVCYPVKDLKGIIQQAGFKIVHSKVYGLNKFLLVEAEKE